MPDPIQFEIELNGEPFNVELNCTIKGLLEKLTKNSDSPNRRFEAVAVELNSEIVARSQFESTILTEGDAVEVVTLVGGG